MSSMNIADFCEYAHICWKIVSNIQNNSSFGRCSRIETNKSTDDTFVKSVVATLDNWRAVTNKSLKRREIRERTTRYNGRLDESAGDVCFFSQYQTALLVTFENLSGCSNIQREGPQLYQRTEFLSRSLETARTVLGHLNCPKNGMLVFED
jgi:hypothetical protein